MTGLILFNYIGLQSFVSWINTYSDNKIPYRLQSEGHEISALLNFGDSNIMADRTFQSSWKEISQFNHAALQRQESIWHELTLSFIHQQWQGEEGAWIVSLYKWALWFHIWSKYLRGTVCSLFTQQISTEHLLCIRLQSRYGGSKMNNMQFLSTLTSWVSHW